MTEPDSASRGLVPARAHGRSLADFGQLSPAEKRLLDCCRSGEKAAIADTCPEVPSDADTVRAGFIRFLLLGGDEQTPVHEHGVRLQGACVTGLLDLEAATAGLGLTLIQCRIEGINAQQAHLKMLDLTGSRLTEGFQADELCCDASVQMTRGFHAIGEVRLLGAAIGGDIDCAGGRFENPRGNALSCDRAQVTGRLLMRNHYGDDGAIVPLIVEGIVDVSLMSVGSLCDDETKWGGATLVLDGFTYARLGGAAPTGAESRIAWLKSQRSDFLFEGFMPQPWEQVIAVLRSMGHPDQARAVAVAKQEQWQRSGRLGRKARLLHRLYGALIGYGYRPLRMMKAVLLVWLVCALAYWRAANPGEAGPAQYLIAPAHREPSAACLAARAAARGGDPCPAPAPDYGNFVPLVYSADVLLPIVDLGYKDDWRPVVSDSRGRPLFWGQALRFLYWFEIAFGWLAGLLLVGVFSNLIKKD
jgi:hypothetical protein